MAATITRDVLESYLNCKYKAHLKQAGQQGSQSDYEALLAETRTEAIRQAAQHLLARHKPEEVVGHLPLTLATLQRGTPLVLDVALEDDVFSLRFDGLKRVEGASNLGSFHYVPMLFQAETKVGKVQRLLLEVQALLLSRIQGRMPGYGVVWQASRRRSTRVRLGRDLRRIEQILRGLQRREASPPRLVLNDHCPVCEFRQRCHQQAIEEDNLSLLRGVGAKDIKNYARKGILTLTQLAHIFRPRRQGKKAPPRVSKRQQALHAMALRDKQVYVLGSPTVPDAPVRVYLDIEGKAEQPFIYLVGLLVVQNGVEERFSFWADNQEQERHIFEQFLEVLARLEQFVVYCYGSYEQTFLRRMKKQARDEAAVDRVLGCLVNVLALVYAHLYFPCYSNGLKDVAGLLGCTWTEPGASGLQSLVWRARWEATRAEQWKQTILRYNQEDCTALRKVTDFIRSATARMAPEAGRTGTAEGPPVVAVQDVKDYSTEREWKTVQFAHPDFEHVNQCAYFDYQRERVYLRSNRAIQRSQRRSNKSRNRKLRCNRQIQVSSSTCPCCQGHSLLSNVPAPEASCPLPRLKRSFDLVLTTSGIRRQVLHCRSSVHKCLECGHTFVPEQHQRLDKHSHGLKAWAMYQHVAHRLDLHAILTMIEEFFGVRVFDREMMNMKALLAHYYGPTIQQLMQAILSGNLLHVDETEVRTQHGKGYVWVFTNLDAVVYLYRLNREADFLREMLAGFRGVLVSDFYAGYDALDCQQQKCLIHLIRDMNQDLLANPFDEELRSVTRPFGALLRIIVTTVDKFGLKRWHLQKHAPEVEHYFQQLSEQVFTSEAAQALQTRLLRCQGRLFTFLEHDGVPWNNNNAENAIKRFAYYREVAPSQIYDEGLKHYLVLLSLYQSCRYKGVNFLRFLMSGERDLDFFSKKRRARERLPALQFYPAGFALPYLPHPPRLENVEVRELSGKGDMEEGIG